MNNWGNPFTSTHNIPLILPLICYLIQIRILYFFLYVSKRIVICTGVSNVYLFNLFFLFHPCAFNALKESGDLLNSLSVVVLFVCTRAGKIFLNPVLEKSKLPTLPHFNGHFFRFEPATSQDFPLRRFTKPIYSNLVKLFKIITGICPNIPKEQQRDKNLGSILCRTF